MSIDEREEYIFHLIALTNKTREYWEKRTDQEVEDAYRELIKLD